MSQLNKLVEHHTKYIETHGIDETVWISYGEHERINHRILFPNHTIEELRNISNAANGRTSKHKKQMKKYWNKNIQTKVFILRVHKYAYVHQKILYNNATENMTITSHYQLDNKNQSSAQKKYVKKNIWIKAFQYTPGPNTRVRTKITYNTLNETIKVSSNIDGQHGLKLPVIVIND